MILHLRWTGGRDEVVALHLTVRFSRIHDETGNFPGVDHELLALHGP
jgi:hypothetical protein